MVSQYFAGILIPLFTQLLGWQVLLDMLQSVSSVIPFRLTTLSVGLYTLIA